jgi:hypothetical protein
MVVAAEASLWGWGQWGAIGFSSHGLSSPYGLCDSAGIHEKTILKRQSSLVKNNVKI